jgi:hypothetical protein
MKASEKKPGTQNSVVQCPEKSNRQLASGQLVGGGLLASRLFAKVDEVPYDPSQDLALAHANAPIIAERFVSERTEGHANAPVIAERFVSGERTEGHANAPIIAERFVSEGTEGKQGGDEIESPPTVWFQQKAVEWGKSGIAGSGILRGTIIPHTSGTSSSSNHLSVDDEDHTDKFKKGSGKRPASPEQTTIPEQEQEVCTRGSRVRARTAR